MCDAFSCFRSLTRFNRYQKPHSMDTGEHISWTTR
jgi:hypothetical protein